MDMSNKVLEHIARKYENIRKGLKSVMGGKILDYEAKVIRNEGISQGISQGITQGIAQGISQGIAQGISQGKLMMLYELAEKKVLSIREAVSQSGLSEDEFRRNMADYSRQETATE